MQIDQFATTCLDIQLTSVESLRYVLIVNYCTTGGYVSKLFHYWSPVTHKQGFRFLNLSYESLFNPGLTQNI